MTTIVDEDVGVPVAPSIDSSDKMGDAAPVSLESSGKVKKTRRSKSKETAEKMEEDETLPGKLY